MPNILEVEGIGQIKMPDEWSPEQIQEWAQTRLPRVREDLQRSRVSETPARVLRDIGSAGWDTVKGLARGFLMHRDALVEDAMREVELTGQKPPMWKSADELAKEHAVTREARLAESPAYKLAEEQQKEGQEFYRTNPKLEETIPSQLIRAGATTLPILAAGAAGPAAPLVGAGLYGAMAGQQGAQEAIEKGHPEKADEAYLAFAGLGAISEAALGYPLALLRSVQAARRAGVKPEQFGRQFRVTLAEAGNRIGREILEGAGREAAQESTEQAGQNVAARMIGYDPNRPLTKNVWEAFWLGGAVGGLFGSVAGTARAIDESPRNQFGRLVEEEMLRPMEQERTPGVVGRELVDALTRAQMNPELAQRTFVPAVLAQPQVPPTGVTLSEAPPEPPAPPAVIAPTEPLPEWVREEMLSRGLDPRRLLNDVDLNNPSVREAILMDPTLTDAQKALVLRTGSIREMPAPVQPVPEPPVRRRSPAAPARKLLAAPPVDTGRRDLDLLRAAEARNLPPEGRPIDLRERQQWLDREVKRLARINKEEGWQKVLESNELVRRIKAGEVAKVPENAAAVKIESRYNDIVIAPSVQPGFEGRWQASVFAKDGTALSHSVHPTLQAAVKDRVESVVDQVTDIRVKKTVPPPTLEVPSAVPAASPFVDQVSLRFDNLTRVQAEALALALNKNPQRAEDVQKEFLREITRLDPQAEYGDMASLKNAKEALEWFRGLQTQPQEKPDALQVRSPAPLPVRQTPEAGPPLVQEIRQPEEPAGAQAAQTQGQVTPKSPLQRDWDALKAQAPDHLLAVRLGDFYEFFNQDARDVAKAARVALTKRKDVDMAGVPVHAADLYFTTLRDAGFNVAIVDSPAGGKRQITDRVAAVTATEQAAQPVAPVASNAAEIAKLRQEIKKLEKQREAKSKKMGAMVPPPIRLEVLQSFNNRIEKIENRISELEAPTPPVSTPPEVQQEAQAQVSQTAAVPVTQWLTGVGGVDPEAVALGKEIQRDIQKLRAEQTKLEGEIEIIRKRISRTTGPRYLRGQIKKSANKADVAEYHALQKRWQEVGSALGELRGMTKPAEVAAAIKTIADDSKPLFTRLMARRELFYLQGQQQPEEFDKAFDAEVRKEVRKAFPDANAAEEDRLRGPVQRAFMSQDPQSSFRMDPELNLNAARWNEISKVAYQAQPELERFPEALQTKISQAQAILNARKEVPPISRAEVDALLTEIPKASEAARAEIAKEEKQAAEAAAKMEIEFTKALKTETARDARAAKTILIRELETALAAAPEEQHGKASVTIEIPGDGTFRIQNNKKSVQAVLDNARALSTATGRPANYVSRGVSGEQAKQFLEEARMTPEEVAEWNARQSTAASESTLRREAIFQALKAANPYGGAGNASQERNFIIKAAKALEPFGITKAHLDEARKRTIIPGQVVMYATPERLFRGLEEMGLITGTAQTQLDTFSSRPNIKLLDASPDQVSRTNLERLRNILVKELGPRQGTQPLVGVVPDLSDQSTAIRIGLEQGARQALERAFGRKFVFFDSPYRLNGAILSTVPGEIYLNIRSARPTSTVIFHELMEHLRLQMPDEYSRFISVLVEEMQNAGEYAQRLAQIEGRLATAPEFLKELAADFAAYESQNPDFWRRMSERLEPSVWRRIGDAILRFLNKVLGDIRGFETTRFFKDVERVRNELADVMATFARQSGGPAVAAGPEQAFFQLEKVFESPETYRRFTEKVTLSEEEKLSLRQQAGAQAALVPDEIAAEIEALNPEDAVEKRMASLLNFVTHIHDLAPALQLNRVLADPTIDAATKDAAIGGVLTQVQRVEVNAKEIDDKLQDSIKTMASLMKARGRIEKQHLIEERSKQIAQNLVAGYKAYLTAQAATLPADSNVAAARQRLLNGMFAIIHREEVLPDATGKALEAIAERISELPVNEGPQAVIDAIRLKDILKDKVSEDTARLMTEPQIGGLRPLLLNPGIDQALVELAALQKKADTYAKQIEIVEQAFRGKGDPTPVQLRRWAETYRKFRNRQADAAKALAEYDKSFQKADQDIQVYGRSGDVLDRLQASPEYQEQMRLALGRPGGEIRSDLYQDAAARKKEGDLTKETVYVSPLKHIVTDEEGKETEKQNTFRVHLAPHIQADRAAVEQMQLLVEEIERYLAGENGPVDPISERTWSERRDYLKQYVIHPKFLQEDAGSTWANPFRWLRIFFGGLSDSLRGEFGKLGLRAAEEAEREVLTSEFAATGYRNLANNEEIGDAATNVATIAAVKSHGWETDRIKFWNQYVLNPIVAAGQTAGQMRLQKGDYIPGTDIQITAEDIAVARMEKRFSQGIVQTTQGTAKGSPALLRMNPVLIEDRFSGKPVLRGAMSPGPLTMARSFSTWGRGFDLQWHGDQTHVPTPEERRRMVQDGDNFQMAVLGYIRTTNPEFENNSPLLKVYEAFAKNGKDDPSYKVNSMDQLLDKLADIAVEQGLFENKADASPSIEATLMKEIGEHITAIRAQFAEDHPGSETVPQQVMQFASSQNAFTKPRKRMVAPDPYYDYTLTHESDRISFVAAALQQFQSRIITKMEALQNALELQQRALDKEIDELYNRGMGERKARKTVTERTARKLGALRFSYEQLLEHKRRLDKLVDQMKALVIDSRNPNDSPLIAAWTRGQTLLSSGLLANPTAIGNNLAGGILSGKNITLWNLGQGRSFWNPKTHARLVSETIKKLLRAVPGTPIERLARSNMPLVKDMAGWVNDMLLEQIQREADAEAAGLISRADLANRLKARGELMTSAGQIDYESPKGVAAVINAAGSLPGVRYALGQLRDKIPGAFDRFMNTNNSRFYQDSLFLDLKNLAIKAFRTREEIAARTGRSLDEINDFSQEANLLTPKELNRPKASGYRDAGRLRQLFNSIGSLDAFLLDYYTRYKAAPEGEKADVPLFPDPADEGAVIYDLESHENLATSGFTPLAFQGVGQRGLIKKLLFMFKNYPTRLFEQMSRMLATDPRDPKVKRELHNWFGVLTLLIISALAGLLGKEAASPIQQAITGRSPSFVKLSNVLENPDAGMLARYVGMGLASNLPYYGGVISQILGNPGYGTWLDAAEYIPAAGLVKDAGLAVRRTAQTGDPIFPATDFIARWFPPASPALRLIPDVAGDIEGRNAARALRVVGPSAGMELAGGAGATYKQTPATLETRRLLAAAYRGDAEGIKEAFDAAVRERAAAGSADPERAVMQSISAAVPARRVFGRSITAGEEAQLTSLMSAGGRADYAKSRDAFDLINRTLGTTTSLTSQPRARRTTGGRRRRTLRGGSRLPRIRRVRSRRSRSRRRSPFGFRQATARRRRRSPTFSTAA